MQLQCPQFQKRSKDISKIVHVTSVVQQKFYESMRILFVRKENNNNVIYSIILLPELPSSAILESTTERNQHDQHYLRSVKAHTC